MRPDFKGDESGRCGGCGSRNLETIELVNGCVYGFCVDCERLQEVEHRDWPESEMCDNCAFRAGSPERKDVWRWLEIIGTLNEGEPFYCHKGLEYDVDSSRFSAPSKESGKKTVCAGWLAAYTAKMKRKSITTEQEG